MADAAFNFPRALQAWLGQIARDRTLWPRGLAIRLALELAAHMNRRSFTAWPSQDRLAGLLGCSVESVRRNALVLESAGHLVIEPGGGRQKSSVYRPVIRPINPHTQGEGVSVPETPTREHRKPPHGAALNPHTQGEGGTLRISEPSEETRASLSVSDGFEAFWNAYPKRRAEDRARKAFERVIREGRATASDVIDGAERFAAWAVGRIEAEGSDRFIPNPATWLSDGGWSDELLDGDSHGKRSASGGPRSTDALEDVFLGLSANANRHPERDNGPAPIEGEATLSPDDEERASW